MAQIFSNNASTTLAAGITSTDAVLTVQSGTGVLFQSPVGGDYELLTLSDADGNIEIVKCTARSGDALTVIRAQEGTTAIAWSSGEFVKGQITKGTLSQLAQGFDNGGNAHGPGSVNLQPSRASSTQVASGASAIAIGKDSTASGVNSIAIGNAAISRIDNAIIMSGTQAIRKAEALGNSNIYGSGAKVAIVTDEFDLLTLADSVKSVTLPVGASFYIDKMAIIITQLTGTVTIHPAVSSGNFGNTTALLASTALAGEVVKGRQVFATPVTYAGQSVLDVSVKTAGTGFALLKGRFMWEGYLVEDQ